MRALVVANRQDPDLGYVGERLDDLGTQIEMVWREDSFAGTLLDGCDLVVLLGSQWSVYDAALRREVAQEQSLVNDAHRRELPVLAICYGAQLIASALGATVSRAVAPEIGWYFVETDNAEQCPTGPWLQFHHDRWSDLGSAPAFPRSDVGPQAFWFKRTFAVQFHPEANTSTIDRWLSEAPDDVAGAGVDAELVREQSRANETEARRRCFTLVDHFSR